MYKEKIVNVQTGEEIIRDFTDEEIAQVEAAKAKRIEIETEREAKRAAALAKLEALGLNEDDLKALGL